MLEIKFTLDATPELISALRDIACAIHCVSWPAAHSSDAMRGDPSQACGSAEKREENDGAADKAHDFPSDAPVEAERPGATENVGEPKKRKPRAKKDPSESNTPVAPAVGDDLSPVGACAEPGPSAPEETNAPETAPETAPEPSPAEEAPSDRAEDPLAGKGQTGEILAELTRKALGDLDALGVDRGDANRRIRGYCARNEIKFPTFPALLQAVGYAEAIAICKGA